MRNFFIALLLTINLSVGFAGVPIDVTESSFVADNPGTMTLHNIAIPGEPTDTTYWATFSWNEETFSWELMNYGADTVTSSSVRLSDTGQTVSYTDTFGEDSDYTGNQPSFKDNGDDTVTDNVTELVWQKNPAEAMTWQEALKYCENLELTGRSDWRLPVPLEAMGILDLSKKSPALDTSVFGQMVDFYWLATESVSNEDEAWSMSVLGAGGMDARSEAKTNSYSARCVRGEPLPYGSFTDNGDATVTDSGTRLMWEQGGGIDKDWESALAYCEELELAGHNDWRGPNIKELWTLFDFSLKGGSIDSTYFTDIATGIFISATTRQNNEVRAWALTVNGGYYVSLDKTEGSVGVDAIRCVRDIKS